MENHGVFLKEISFDGNFEYKNRKFFIPFIDVYEKCFVVHCMGMIDYKKALSFYNDYAVREEELSNEELEYAEKINPLNFDFLPSSIVINGKTEAERIFARNDIYISAAEENGFLSGNFAKRNESFPEKTAFRYFELTFERNTDEEIKNIEFKDILETKFGETLCLKLGDCTKGRKAVLKDCYGKDFEIIFGGVEESGKDFIIEDTEEIFAVIKYKTEKTLEEEESIEAWQEKGAMCSFGVIPTEKEYKILVVTKANKNEDTEFCVRYRKEFFSDAEVEN